MPMYLSDSDLQGAVDDGSLIIDPPPKSYDPTSVDLHLDKIANARIWDVAKYTRDQSVRGVGRPELRIGAYNLAGFSRDFLTPPPEQTDAEQSRVLKRHNEIIVRPGGFLLWQTLETVGTPQDAPKYICFVDGKSTRARAGIVVHLTAPTIHSGWSGNITLEIANLGPFDLVLRENDVIAQLTVAKISNPPTRMMASTSQTYKQNTVGGTSS